MFALLSGMSKQKTYLRIPTRSDKVNSKVGRIPISTSSKKNCPNTCPLKESGCYAKYGPLSWHWNKVTDGTRGDSYQKFLDRVKALPDGQLWRHNQAGDLEGTNNDIDVSKLAKLTIANQGKKVIAYTHKPVTTSANVSEKQAKHNRDAIKQANEAGFTINLSANTVEQADEYKALNIAPVVTVLPLGHAKLSYSPAGNKVVACPAQYKDNVTCASCKLCSIRDRNFIIGFEAHGTATNKASAVASGKE